MHTKYNTYTNDELCNILSASEVIDIDALVEVIKRFKELPDFDSMTQENEDSFAQAYEQGYSDGYNDACDSD